MYRVYQKEVNSLKNNSKLKSIRYLDNILFLINKPMIYLPRVQNPWCVTINNDSVAIFVSQAKMQLHQGNNNQNSFEMNLRGLTFILWGHDEYAWGQRSISGHVWPSEITMNMYEVRGWDFSLEVKTQLKVTHALELTPDLMQTHRDLTGWR